MIERRYVGVQTVGRTATVLERIRQVVRSCNQTHAIPIIKIEKKARGQFYIFLAIEGVEGSRLPDPIVNVLRIAGLTGRQYWPLTLSEIKFMVSTAEVETYGFSALSYEPPWDREVGDPYDLSDDMASEPRQQTHRSERDTINCSIGCRRPPKGPGRRSSGHAWLLDSPAIPSMRGASYADSCSWGT